MTDAQRTSSPIDQIAEAWVDTIAELSPSTATYIGRSEHNRRLDDLSLAGHEARRAAAADMFSDIDLDAPVASDGEDGGSAAQGPDDIQF